jgi:hypothetical protein
MDCLLAVLKNAEKYLDTSFMSAIISGLLAGTTAFLTGASE